MALGAVWARAVRLSVPAGLARVFEGLRGENGVAAGAGAGGEDPTATLASLGIEAASVADLYHRWSLSTVGHVPSGLAGVVRVPPCQWPLGPLLLAVLPLAFLVFVEHYAITRRIARWGLCFCMRYCWLLRVCLDGLSEYPLFLFSLSSCPILSFHLIKCHISTHHFSVTKRIRFINISQELFAGTLTRTFTDVYIHLHTFIAPPP